MGTGISVTSEPPEPWLRPIGMFLDILAIIVCIATAWWLIATAPDLR